MPTFKRLQVRTFFSGRVYFEKGNTDSQVKTEGKKNITEGSQKDKTLFWGNLYWFEGGNG